MPKVQLVPPSDARDRKGARVQVRIGYTTRSIVEGAVGSGVGARGGSYPVRPLRAGARGCAIGRTSGEGSRPICRQVRRDHPIKILLVNYAVTRRGRRTWRWGWARRRTRSCRGIEMKYLNWVASTGDGRGDRISGCNRMGSPEVKRYVEGASSVGQGAVGWQSG